MPRAGDTAAALSGYRESLAISRALVAEFPANALLGRSLATSLNNLAEQEIKAGDVAGGRAKLAEALGLERATVRSDPENQDRPARAGDHAREGRHRRLLGVRLAGR